MTADANGETIGWVTVICVKLAFAALDATDCAIDGTVNCANREEGRPERTGTPSEVSVAVLTTGFAGASGTATLLLEAGFVVLAVLALGSTTRVTGSGFFFEMGKGVGETGTTGRDFADGCLVAVVGLATAGTIFLTVALTAAFFGAALATGLAAGFVITALATVLPGFAAATGLTTLAFVANFTDLTGLVALAVLAVCPGLTVTFLDLLADVFTIDLLAGCSCGGEASGLVSRTTAFSSARECSGLAAGKPINCKSETNIKIPKSG